MLFGIDPAGMVVPTIGPRGLLSMYSITGASTFQPPCALRAKAEQGMGIFCAEPGSALNNTTLAAAILKRDRRRQIPLIGSP